MAWRRMSWQGIAERGIAWQRGAPPCHPSQRLHVDAALTRPVASRKLEGPETARVLVMKWFVGAALLLLAALLLQSSLLAYAMYVLLSLLLLSRVLAFAWVGHLHATRTCKCSTAEIGDKVAVSVTVHNAGPLPVPWALLEDLLPHDALLVHQPRLRVKGKRIQIAMLWGGSTLEL